MNFTVINPFYQNLLNHTSIPHISFTISRVKSQKRSQLCAPCTKPLNLFSSINLNIDQNPRFLTLKTRARNQQFTPFLATLSKNPTFVSGLCALVLAQCVKTMLNFCVEKKWNLRTLCSSGGMPSSHSAMCTALTTSVAICHGVADSLFPVCLGFSVIVMYDAIGVRRHAGMQAQVLNKIIEDLFQGHPISERKLKELLGHTPSQVFAGALLGIAVAWYCCRGCLAPI